MRSEGGIDSYHPSSTYSLTLASRFLASDLVVTASLYPTVPHESYSKSTPHHELLIPSTNHKKTDAHSRRPATTDNARTSTLPPIAALPTTAHLLAMGKLIKNHWARLIILTAAAYQIAASIAAFFWPKLFWDFLTTNLDHAVRPVPILQIINLLLGLLGLCWEWPLPLFTTAATSTRLHNNHSNAAASGSRKHHKHTSSNASPPRAPSKATTALAAMHRSIEARLFIYPLSSLAALLLYQGTNAGIYYIIGMGVYFWGFSEGEVVMGVPWTLPRRRKVQGPAGV